MRLPPWAIQAIRNGVADVAKKASDAETIAKVKEQASELLRELPENASRGIDRMVESAAETARGAFRQGRDTVMRWTERQTEMQTHCFNASGVLLSPQGSGIRLSDHVMAAGCDLLQGAIFHGTDQTPGLRSQLDHSLNRLLGIDGCEVAVASNFDAAIASIGALSVPGTLSSKTMVMHRSQAIRLPSGIPLPDAIPGVTIQECGGVQQIVASDFDGLHDSALMLADDGTHPFEPVTFDGNGNIRIAVLPVATVTESIDQVPCAAELLRQGIDLVVLPGGPMTGGPHAGVMVGRSRWIETIRTNRRWKSYVASDVTAAMTLAAMTEPDVSPVKELIETSTENLRSRAERMAIRLSASEAVKSCQVTDQPARLTAEGRWEFPSRQLRLRHPSQNASEWAKQVCHDGPVVMTATDENDLIIDLRWIAASDDAALSDRIAGDVGTDQDERSEPHSQSV